MLMYLVAVTCCVHNGAVMMPTLS